MRALRLLKDAAKAYLDRSGLPYGQRFRMTRLGFAPESYVIYEFDRNDPADYLPSSLWAPLHRLNGPVVTEMLSNKLLFWYAFAGDVPMPTVLAAVMSGHVRPVADTALRSAGAVLELAAQRPLILKPMGGQKGKRVHRLESEGGRYLLDHAPVGRAEAEAALLEGAATLVVELAQQAPYAAAFNPGSVNTMRVVTFGGEGTGYAPFVAAIAHRFGREGTGPVDNVSSGGLIARVDRESYEIGPAAGYPFGARRLVWYDEHPDTGARIAGAVVPGAAAVVERLLRLMEAHPYLVYVGWDVVLTDERGGFSVIEANYGAGLQIQMVGFRYLRDERVVAFLGHHGLLDQVPVLRRPPAAAGRSAGGPPGRPAG
jgi:hypothetical protein